MSRTARLTALTAAAALTLGLAACSTDTDEPAADAAATDAAAGSGDQFPVTVEHAFGSSTIEEKPERVATVAWANHEIALALGVVPVGMAATPWGDDDGDGVHPWVEDELDELGAEMPAVFDETDGIDFEAVADTNPDVILAAYSGLSQEDYDTLSQIAPVVAYQSGPWATTWREMIEINSAGLGLSAEGDQLIADLKAEIAGAVAEHPEIEGATAMMVTHVDPTDLSEISFYSANDPRSQYFEDLGMAVPQSLIDSTEGDSYNGSVSTENADIFSDVDIFVTYGGDELIEALEADPVLSQLPAVADDAIVNLPGDGPLGTAANPTPLQIPYILDDYLDALAGAVQD
ncbi:iron-siderophore ABC transporter substrate-binding protein [Isoptericola halotolerans]|uniref:iron-siderophore ABC transporter substrate-binding protein n=1 Tax=Isoptericola halotolerans TaxID=300560 RepID=UPI00388EF42A